MKPSNLFLVSGVIALIYGLLLLIMPDQFLSNFSAAGMTAPLAGLGRTLGATLVGLGTIFLLGRESTGAACAALATGILVGNGLSALNQVYGILQGGLNSMAWINVAIIGGLAVWAAMVRFGKS